uniref:uncharacterized protein C24H6.02c n=1 Tax=Erigeron canadensis TaxID=72917 RepID=UPI001CB8D72D|nr:uncharacterized protein C24H6.02c [Erigeron canadensis]
MAAWRMQRRLLSLVRQPNIPPFRTNDSSSQFKSSVNSLIRGDHFIKRQTRTFSETSAPSLKNAIEHAASSSSNKIENSVATDPPRVTYTANSQLKVSPRHDLAMMFTCTKCDTRSLKTISRESYEKGVVVARCGGCNNYHLIADHLGIFGEKCNIEDILAARGEEVRKGNSDTLNLTLDDLVGMTKSSG